jgi:hypothetical protein
MSRNRFDWLSGSVGTALFAFIFVAGAVSCRDAGSAGGGVGGLVGVGGASAGGGAGGLAGVDGVGGAGAGGAQPGGCVRLTCDSAACFPGYCGDIGDGCGGVLHCPTTCENNLYLCRDHVCTYTGTACILNSCTANTGDHYCGTIGVGAPACLKSMDCPPCPDGWQCQNKLCVGISGQCKKRLCANATGTSYCGTINDGCGGQLVCNSCPIDGWVCQNKICIGPPDVCTKGTCSPSAGVQYCGSIGDGCGGTLKCPAACADGTTCGAVIPNVCGAATGAPAPQPAPVPDPGLPGVPPLPPCPAPPPAPV